MLLRRRHSEAYSCAVAASGWLRCAQLRSGHPSIKQLLLSQYEVRHYEQSSRIAGIGVSCTLPDGCDSEEKIAPPEVEVVVHLTGIETTRVG